MAAAPYPNPLSSSTSRVDSLLSGLTPESTLRDLPLYSDQLESHCLGKEAAHILDNNPLLPGILLFEDGQLAGIISRQRFLEEMSRPYGLDLFLNRPIKVLYSFASTEVMVFSGNTLIVSAARQSLARSPEYLYEPVVVQLEPQVYRLLDAYQLLVAQSHVHELTRQLLDKQNQAQMIQAEKMASLGRLVAGVAHEILNPVNFISGNIRYLSSYIQELIQLLSLYNTEIPELPDSITKAREDIGIDFLLDDLPKLIDSMNIGTERLKNIAGSLRNFSYMSESDRRLVDIHQCIESTLLILNTRLKLGIEIIKNYGEVPLVNCHFSQISQVFMNIIGNAIDALEEKIKENKLNATEWNPQIKITTEVYSSNNNSSCDRWVLIRIADNGAGVPLEIQSRIFETFFTTKPMGEGTGLGLAISHQIITEKHSGRINLRSEPGVGTEFEILLPL